MILGRDRKPYCHKWARLSEKAACLMCKPSREVWQLCFPLRPTWLRSRTAHFREVTHFSSQCILPDGQTHLPWCHSCKTARNRNSDVRQAACRPSFKFSYLGVRWKQRHQEEQLSALHCSAALREGYFKETFCWELEQGAEYVLTSCQSCKCVFSSLPTYPPTLHLPPTEAWRKNTQQQAAHHLG